MNNINVITGFADHDRVTDNDDAAGIAGQRIIAPAGDEDSIAGNDRKHHIRCLCSKKSINCGYCNRFLRILVLQ